MSPYEIKILLHYATSAKDMEFTGAELEVSTLQQFVQLGLLRNGSDAMKLKYYATQRLKVYCQALGAVQLPVQRWVMPKGEAPDE